MILWYFMFIVDRHVCSQLHNVSHRDAAGQSGEIRRGLSKGTDLVAMYRNHERQYLWICSPLSFILAESHHGYPIIINNYDAKIWQNSQKRTQSAFIFCSITFPCWCFFGEWVNPSGRERTWRLELNPAGSQRESLRISPSIVIAHDKSKQCSHGFLLQHQSPNAFISLCLFVRLLRASVSFCVVFLSLYYIPSIHVSSSYSFFALSRKGVPALGRIFWCCHCWTSSSSCDPANRGCKTVVEPFDHQKPMLFYVSVEQTSLHSILVVLCKGLWDDKVYLLI